MPPSIWARITSGLTAMPQSTAHTTRSTLGRPSLRSETSATWATKLPNDSWTAMPRARPAGSGEPQPAFAAASSSTPRCRGWSASSSRRSSKGSRPAAWASSSKKVSVENAVWLCPTERHHRVGTPTSGECSSTAEVRDRVGQGRAALDRRGVDPVLDEAGEGRPLQEGLADDAVLPGHDPARGVEAGAEADGRRAAGSARRGCRPRGSTRASPAAVRRWPSRCWPLRPPRRPRASPAGRSCRPRAGCASRPCPGAGPGRARSCPGRGSGSASPPRPRSCPPESFTTQSSGSMGACAR